jgi:putative ABC transport system permease protein
MRGYENYSFAIVGQPVPPPDKRPNTGYIEISPGLLESLKIPLRKGRFLDDHDTQTAPWAVVINEAFAHRYFPNVDPIGQQLLVRYEPWPVDEDRPRKIVGIVGDVKHRSLAEPASPFLYVSYQQQSVVFPGGSVTVHLNQNLVVRTVPGFTGHEADLAASVKTIASGLGLDQPVTDLMSMNHVLAASMGDARFYMDVFGLFAGIAVLLAVVGIYGVMSYFVSERTHEIGIRVALGALPSDVIGLVGTLGLKLTLIGIAIGIGLAIGLTRLISEFLFGVKPTDPVTYAAVAIGLILVALLACYIPARRASRVDPMVALRYE